MPKLSPVGEVPVAWNRTAMRYTASAGTPLAEVFNRLRPVPDPIIVTTGPNARPGGDLPWEGDDPASGRRYVARKKRDCNAVLLQEVVDF